MFVQTTRWSFADAGKKGQEIYDRAKPMWTTQSGFRSMSLFDIVDGPHKGQRMVVMR